MEFKACKYLSFDEKMFSGNLVQIASHLGWERIDPDGKLQLCQQCTKRGRINQAQACIGESRAACSDYEEVTVEFSNS